MHSCTIILLLVNILIIIHTVDAFLWWNPDPKDYCPERESASPYYFGTTDLTCMMRSDRRKREIPQRSKLLWAHRFIYYKGYYFEFGSNTAHIGTNRSYNHCSGSVESKPAGYSTLSLDCIKSCTSNYRCYFGDYHLLNNNCHSFANRLSKELCLRTRCPRWCTDDNAVCPWVHWYLLSIIQWIMLPRNIFTPKLILLSPIIFHFPKSLSCSSLFSCILLTNKWIKQIYVQTER